MDYIIAIIQPDKLDAVQKALSDQGVTGMTVSEVHGYGRQKGKNEVYRGAEHIVNFVPKVKIEIAVPRSKSDAVCQTVIKVAKTGKIGDGKLFKLQLSEAIRIRTGETGEIAL